MAELPLPTAELKLDGRTVSRTPVVNDYGTRIQWKITRDGVEIATPDARGSTSYTHSDATPGQYEIVLETWKHEGYRAGALGKYIAISNKVAYRI